MMHMKTQGRKLKFSSLGEKVEACSSVRKSQIGYNQPFAKVRLHLKHKRAGEQIQEGSVLFHAKHFTDCRGKLQHSEPEWPA